MKSVSRPFLVLALLLCIGWATPRPEPAARKVVAPGFDQEGHRIWELRAEEATPRPDGAVDARGMLLTTFSGPRAEIRIEAAEARFHPDEGRATGSSGLLARGSNYEIRGRLWIWEAEERRIAIEGGVTVIFEEELSNLLD